MKDDSENLWTKSLHIKGIHWNDLQTNPTMASCERKVQKPRLLNPTRLSVSTGLLRMLESPKK